MLRLFCVLFLITPLLSNSQDIAYHKKGEFYFNWGWNRGHYTKSDIRFTGSDYNFTLYDVKSEDEWDDKYGHYLNPGKLSIPQYNVRFGYFIKDNLAITIGTDHMKYVMINGQTVRISGDINTPSAGNYIGHYLNDEIVLDPDFIEFEHTDGLNYPHIGLDLFHDLWRSKNNKHNLSIMVNAGLGALFPRTNTTMFRYRHRDEFNFTGWGFSSGTALRFDFLSHFYLQFQVKGGFIGMDKIITFKEPGNYAKQNFWFVQEIGSFGAMFSISKK